jgi:hypothetical protein
VPAFPATSIRITTPINIPNSNNPTKCNECLAPPFLARPLYERTR